MSKRFAWLLGVVVLVSIAVLVACGSNYNRSSDGLVLVASQGSGLIETFGFSLSSGSISEIANPPETTSTQTCVLNGIPSSIVVDPSGSYAYTIVSANVLCKGSQTGLAAFRVNSNGTLTASGSLVPFAQENVVVQGAPESVPVVPYALSMDAAGKFLFVADRATLDNSGNNVPGAISAFTINNGTLTEVAGSPFVPPPSTTVQPSLDIVAVASTPTVLPGVGANGVQNAVCSTPGNKPPTSQYLYAVDLLGNQVIEYSVDTTTGALGNPPNATAPLAFFTDQQPAGVAVDPCNRFVYVTDHLTNKVSAYTMCNGGLTQSPTGCPQVPNGSLVQVSGSPFSLAGSASGPGPLVVDPFGNYVYVLNTLSGGVSTLKISSISGALTANATVVATGALPTSLAIRADDNWLFVANFGSAPATISQYSIVPSTGVLTPLPAIQTDNNPWGVAVR